MAGPTAEERAAALAAQCNVYDYEQPRSGLGSQGTIVGCGQVCERTTQVGGGVGGVNRYASTLIGQCSHDVSSRGPPCSTSCPLNTAIPTGLRCSTAGSHRQICERNIGTFKPIREGNVNEQCCTLPLSNMAERDARDCPQAYHQTANGQQSPVCSNPLLRKCVTMRKNPDEILGAGCDALSKEEPVVRGTYNSAMSSFCMQDLYHLNKPECATWCNDNPTECDRAKVTDLCKTMGPRDFDTYRKTCGCFLNHTIYDKVKKKVLDKYKIYPSIEQDGRKCYFPACKNATIKEYPDESCLNKILVNCMQDVDVNNDDVTIGQVRLNREGDCKTEFTQLFCDPSCKEDEYCDDGECKQNSCALEGVQCDYKTQRCSLGECVFDPDKVDNDDGGFGVNPIKEEEPHFVGNDVINYFNNNTGVIFFMFIAIIALIGTVIYLATRKITK